MNNLFIRQNVFPVLAALIWGVAFVAQSVGAGLVGPFTFNAVRNVLAFLFLLAICLGRNMWRTRQTPPLPPVKLNRELVVAGICCGIALSGIAFFQQKGLETTTAGKAGFITALYIVLVPIAGLFLNKKAPKTIVASVVLAVIGLYLLCINEAFSVTVGDIYVLICAFCCTAHILVIDHFSQKADGIAMSCMQFLVTAVISFFGMVITESPSLPAIVSSAVPILYTGICSSGIGFTLQILAQKGTDPTRVSLLMSLESVFAVLAGAILLGDQMSEREYLGCLLMLAAVILAQLPDPKKANVE